MKRLPLIILCVILLCGTLAHAEDDDIFKRQYNALELDSLTRQSPQNIEIKKDISLDSGLSALFKSLLGQIGGVFKKGLSCITIIIAIAVLTAIIKSMYNTGSKAVPVCISAVSAVAVTAAAAGSITTLIGMGQSAIEGMNVFSKSLLPTLAASITATGAPLGGAARYAATVMFSDIIITLINTVLMPLVYTYIAAATANAALEDASLSKITDFLHWIVTGSLKILIGVFVFYITVSGIIASTTDVVGAKTARFALNGAVPVVGGILSDAAGTVIAGAMAIKNAIGIFGMLTILSICLTPFLTIAVNYFLFRAAAALTSPICDERISGLVERIGTGFGVVFGMTASCALLFFVSILSCMFAVGAA